MNIDHINKLLALGQLSLDLHAAERAVESAKHTYHEAFRTFECDGDDPDECSSYANRITRDSPRWDEAMAHTKPEFEAYMAAKREAKKVKRRWKNACMKLESQIAA